MEDKKLNMHLYAHGENNELTIRNGEAPEVFIPPPTAIKSTINGPADYASLRPPVDKSVPLIQYSIQNAFILYSDDIRSQSIVEIRGELRVNPDLSMLNVNSQSPGISPRDLAMKLKRIRYCFPDLEAYQKLILSLTNLNATITTVLESNENAKGDRRRLIDKTVNSNIDTTFKIHIPIFVGTEPVTMFIELYVDTSESEVRVQLISPDLIQAQFDITSKLINEELSRFDTAIPKLHIL